MNESLKMRKEKIRQEMKELKVEILDQYLQTAKDWDEAVKVLLAGGYDKKRDICLVGSLEKLLEEEAEFIEVMDDDAANLLHKELLLMKDETAIAKQKWILEKYLTFNAYWEFIHEMDDLASAYEDVKIAEDCLNLA